MKIILLLNVEAYNRSNKRLHNQDLNAHRKLGVAKQDNVLGATTLDVILSEILNMKTGKQMSLQGEIAEGN
jgi:hypothetical protein